MTTEQKRNENRFRFSHEITLGDLCIAIGLIMPFSIWLCSLEFRAETHEKLLTTHESALVLIAKSQEAAAVNNAITEANLENLTARVDQIENRPVGQLKHGGQLQ